MVTNGGLGDVAYWLRISWRGERSERGAQRNLEVGNVADTSAWGHPLGSKDEKGQTREMC